MKIDDKEIERLLEGFESEDIKIPEELGEKLDLKLKELKPKKYKRWISVSVASILILGISYAISPSFRTFGDTVFKYIFGDIGIENAVNSGYKGSPRQDINISDYNISIENIYMDDLRISFDAIIENYADNGENQYSLYAEGEQLDNIAINNGLFFKDGKEFKANVQIIGDNVSKLINGKDKLELNLKLVRHYNIKVNGDYELKDETIGTSKLILDIPKDIEKTRYININETIKDKDLNLTVEKLEMAPTMMYLHSYGKLDGVGEVQGLYNFKIISDKGDIYKENLVLSGIGKENGFRQSIVPSAYYDKNDKLKLRADGVFIDANKKVEINLNGSYPKVIDYFGYKVTINQVKYENNQLIVEVLNNNIFDHMGVNYIDGDSTIEGYFNGEIHGLVFDIDKRDSYDLSLGLILKYKIPINIEIKNTNT